MNPRLIAAIVLSALVGVLAYVAATIEAPPGPERIAAGAALIFAGGIVYGKRLA